MKTLFAFLLTVFVSTAQATPSYPPLQSPTGLTDPSLAIHPDHLADYGQDFAFLNWAKSMRLPVGNKSGEDWGFYSFEKLKDGGHLDANHYPVSIPGDADEGIVYTWDLACGADQSCLNEANGSFTFTWEGTGVLTINGGTNQVVGDHEITLDINANSPIHISVTSTSAAPNNIKNFKMVKDTDRALYEAGAIFNPEFLNRMRGTRVLRFMDWMYANYIWQYSGDETGSEIPPDWDIDKLPTVTMATYTDGWVPPEIMVALSNEIGADPWFNFSYMATTAYVNAFAKIVKEQLDPDLVAHFELSNEVWNGGFAQYYSAFAMANIEFGAAQGGSSTCIDASVFPWRQHYGKRFYEVMSEVSTVFSGLLDRIVRVQGTQSTGDGSQAKASLDADAWACAVADPNSNIYGESYTAPYTVTDAVAGVSYFGYTSIAIQRNRDGILSAVLNPAIEDHAYHYDLARAVSTTYNSSLEGSASSATTDSSSYSLDDTVITLSSSGSGDIVIGDMIAFQNSVLENIESGSTITYSAPDLILDSANGFGGFSNGMSITVTGTPWQDGVYTIGTASAGQLELVEQTLYSQTSTGNSQIVESVQQYRVTSGDANVADGGSITIAPGLTATIPDSPMPVTVVSNAMDISRMTFINTPTETITVLTGELAALNADDNYNGVNYNDIRLMLYEGGQHIHHLAFLDIPQEDVDALQVHLNTFVESSYMADLYEVLWDGWKNIPGEGPFMQYTAIADSSIWGTWGLYDNLTGVLKPRAIFLEAENAITPAWWESRAGTHFQEGLAINGTSGNDTIAGTNEEDYVLAGAGDDLIYVGPGWGDRVNGGTGDDDIYLMGVEGSWTIVGTPTTGYTFTNVAEDVSNLTVFAVEEAIFEDEGVLELNTDLNQGGLQ